MTISRRGTREEVTAVRVAMTTTELRSHDYHNNLDLQIALYVNKVP